MINDFSQGELCPVPPMWPQHICGLLPRLPPGTPSPYSFPGPGVWGPLPSLCPASHSPDLVAIHPVAVPQGEDLAQRDGDGEPDHSDGEGIAQELCKQLGAGGHRGHQPVRGIGEAKGRFGPGCPTLPDPRGAGAHPEGILPTMSTPNACFRPAP